MGVCVIVVGPVKLTIQSKLVKVNGYFFCFQQREGNWFALDFSKSVSKSSFAYLMARRRDDVTQVLAYQAKLLL